MTSEPESVLPIVAGPDLYVRPVIKVYEDDAKTRVLRILNLDISGH